VCKIGPKTVLKRSNNNYGTIISLKYDMCQDKKKDKSEEHENDIISSYTRIVNEKKKKKKKTIMEMFLPYISH